MDRNNFLKVAESGGNRQQIDQPSGEIKFKSDDLVCFCFEHTRNDIERDYLDNGKSAIMAAIATGKKGGRCDCAVKNPKGR